MHQLDPTGPKNPLTPPDRVGWMVQKSNLNPRFLGETTKTWIHDGYVFQFLNSQGNKKTKIICCNAATHTHTICWKEHGLDCIYNKWKIDNKVGPTHENKKLLHHLNYSNSYNRIKHILGRILLKSPLTVGFGHYNSLRFEKSMHFMILQVALSSCSSNLPFPTVTSTHPQILTFWVKSPNKRRHLKVRKFDENAFGYQTWKVFVSKNVGEYGMFVDVWNGGGCSQIGWVNIRTTQLEKCVKPLQNHEKNWKTCANVIPCPLWTRFHFENGSNYLSINKTQRNFQFHGPCPVPQMAKCYCERKTNQLPNPSKTYFYTPEN